MEKIENECCSCGLPCIGAACRNFAVSHFYCDECGEESTLYEYEDQQLCCECLCSKFKKVEGSDDE